jgi:hypothetical protein
LYESQERRPQLGISPREQHIALQAAREQQQMETSRKQYKRRAGLESNFIQGNRHCDLCHVRYISLAKVDLQRLVTPVAINLIQAMAWLSGNPRAETRMWAFASLLAGTS